MYSSCHVKRGFRDVCVSVNNKHQKANKTAEILNRRAGRKCSLRNFYKVDVMRVTTTVVRKHTIYDLNHLNC